MKSCIKNQEPRITGNPVSTNVELQFYCGLFESLRSDAAGPAGVTYCHASVPECSQTVMNLECLNDIRKFRNRVANEGLTFLTTTLPSLGKAIDKALLGDSDAFVGVPFKLNGPSKLPRFLGWLMRLVFTDDGCVRSDANAQSLRLLRQLCFLFYKLEVPYANSVNDDVVDRFIATDAELPTQYHVVSDLNLNKVETETFKHETKPIRAPEFYLGSPLCSGQTKSLPCFISERAAYHLAVARYIIGTVLGGANPRDIVGRHGPGAVATGECGAEKINFTRLYRQLDRIYPFDGYFHYSLTHTLDECDQMQNLMVLDTGTAKVVLVPKDSRGPRLISCEPLAYQWIQQGQMDLLTKTISTSKLTRGHVNFTDQTVNQTLASQGSITGALATIDLRDASDRVSLALFRELFPLIWVEALEASRSPKTKLPSGSIMMMKKFAPMGSAVCFPVEALIFFALSVASVYCKRISKRDGDLALRQGSRIDKSMLRRAAESIYVYGDDIICATEDCGSVISGLEAFHLKVNTSKCCTTGSFRESCGVDAFKGINVTPVRIKRRWISDTNITPETYLAYVAQSNAFFAKGYIEAAWYLERAVQALRRTPYSSKSDPEGIAFSRPHAGWHATLTRVRTRYNEHLQRLEVQTYIVVPTCERGSDLGWREMLRCETLADRAPLLPNNVSVGRAKAGYYAVPRSYKLKRGWMPAGD